jgi:flagellar basal-body rod protein FlgB
MTSRLDQVFAFHENALRLGAQRQQLLASNMANADTPNYKAKDMDFSKLMHSALAEGKSASASALAQTTPGHLSAQLSAQMPDTYLRKPLQNNLDGNTVDMDVERNSFAENAMHYEAEVSFTQGAIKGLLAVLQG